MTSDPRAALREKVADIILDSTEPTFERIADAVIAVVLEEAARVAETNAAEAWTEGADETRGLMRLQAQDIAAAIRAMMGTD